MTLLPPPQYPLLSRIEMSLGPELQFLFIQDLETSKNPQLVSPQCLRLYKLIGKACSFFFPSLEFWRVERCFPGSSYPQCPECV